MEETLVIGAGPAGLLAATVACRNGARVRVLGAGIGTTHIMPGWLAVLKAPARLDATLQAWIQQHPDHPYALAGLDALGAGLEVFRDVCAESGLAYTGDLKTNHWLPTAMGAIVEAAVVPQSFAAGNVNAGDPYLIAGPAGWRDFYPSLCADNLRRQGLAAEAATFELPEIETSKFDSTAANMARIFHRPDVRARVAAELRGKLNGARRLGMPAILGLEDHSRCWRELQDRVGVPVFEIPTLPPSVPGMRIWLAFKTAFIRAGIQLLLDMQVARGMMEGYRTCGVVVPGAARETVFRADKIILATGGLYGGGIQSDHHGTMYEAVFGLPVSRPGNLGTWFQEKLLAGDHPAHYAGVRVDKRMAPLDSAGNEALENVRVAGRLLAGYNPVIEGSTEGAWLATAYRAATS